MAGGVLEIIGLVALLVALCELAARGLAGRSTEAQLQRQREALSAYPPARDLWQIDVLRRKGAL